MALFRSLSLSLSLSVCVCAYPILTRRDDWWTIYYNAKPIIIHIYIYLRCTWHRWRWRVNGERREQEKEKKKEERKKCFFSWPTRDTAGDCVRTKTFRRRTDAKVSNDAGERIFDSSCTSLRYHRRPRRPHPYTAVQSLGLNVRKSCALIFFLQRLSWCVLSFTEKRLK